VTGVDPRPADLPRAPGDDCRVKQTTAVRKPFTYTVAAAPSVLGRGPLVAAMSLVVRSGSVQAHIRTRGDEAMLVALRSPPPRRSIDRLGSVSRW